MKKELNFNEYKFVKVDNEVIFVYNNEKEFNDYANFKEVLPELNAVPEEIQGYKFNHALVVLQPTISHDDSEVNIDKVYYYDNLSILRIFV